MGTDAFGKSLGGQIQLLASDMPDPYIGFGAQWGHAYEQDTGLYLLGEHYYDPTQNRFLTRDPIGYAGGLNLYAFVGNNPLAGADPFGLDVSIGDIGRQLLNPNTWGSGVTTGASAVTHVFSGGFYSPPASIQNSPGYGASEGLAGVGAAALGLAAAAPALGPMLSSLPWEPLAGAAAGQGRRQIRNLQGPKAMQAATLLRCAKKKRCQIAETWLSVWQTTLNQWGKMHRYSNYLQ